MGVLIWTDNFDSYTAGSAVPSPWAGVSNSPVSSTQAHSGANSLAVGSGGNGSDCYRPIGSNLSQWYADFWMYSPGYTGGNPAGIAQYIGFAAATSAGNPPYVSVGNATGAGQAGAFPAIWITFTVSTGAWHHYLLEVTSSATGTAKLTIDGTVIGTYSGDTRDNAATAYAAYVRCHGGTIGPSPPAEFYVDDLSVYSGIVTSAAAQAYAMILA